MHAPTVVCRYCGEPLRQSSYASLTFWTHEDGNVACHWGPHVMSLYGTNAEPRHTGTPRSKKSSQDAHHTPNRVQEDET